MMRAAATEGVESASGKRTSWRFAIASCLSSLLTCGLLMFYAHVHWDIVFGQDRHISEADREKWLSVLNALEAYRLFGLLAIVLAVFALTRRPRWPALIYVPLAIMAGVASFVVM